MKDAYCLNVASFCPRCEEDVRADFLVFGLRGAQIGKYCQTHAHEEVARINKEVKRREGLKP